MVARRRWVAIGIVVATALVSCDSGSDDTAARRRRNATETGSPVTSLPAPTTTTQPGEPTTRVAYVWDRDVWVNDTASGVNVRLTADRHLGAETAVRMHGGDHVTYTSVSELYGYEFDGTSTVVDVDLTSGARSELFSTDGYVVDIDWSPDGTKLAVFETARNGARVVSIVTPASATVAPVFQTPGGENGDGFGIGFPQSRPYYDQHVEWSADGTRLLVADATFAVDDRWTPTLFVLDPSGAVVATRSAMGAEWLTSSTVVVTSTDRNGSLELFDITSKVSRRLATRGGATHPRTSPDHNLVAYDNRDGSAYVYDVENGEDRRLGDGGMPLWLDREHVLIEAVTGDCPPTSTTRCGSPLAEAGHSSVVAVSSLAATQSSIAATFIAAAWTGPTTSTVAPPPAALPAVGGDGITINARIGYAGVGPLAIGTVLGGGDHVAGSKWFPLTCDLALFPELSSGLTPEDVFFYTDQARRITGITVTNPQLRTISGIHVGSTEAEVRSTYANVEWKSWNGAPPTTLVITNSEGRQVLFGMSHGIVSNILVAESAQSIEDHSKC